MSLHRDHQRTRCTETRLHSTNGTEHGALYTSIKLVLEIMIGIELAYIDSERA